MSDSSEKPWSDGTYAPQIPHLLYTEEKGSLVGSLIGAISYGTLAYASFYPCSPCLGIIIALFFQCMGALFDPAYRTTGKIKWPLVAHAVVMFSFVTIFTGMSLYVQSMSFIDTRDFSGNTLLPPGPIGYQLSLSTNALSIVPAVSLFMNNWLADGLLVRVCVQLSRPFD